MPCYHPLIAVDRGIKENGKRDYKILPGYVPAAEAFSRSSGEGVMEIPCGHCIGCRRDQSLEWSNRLLMESLYHDTAYFVTLTYCDEYRPHDFCVNLNSGEVEYVSNLKKEDAQNFIKRLRYYHPDDNIVYYIAGEYGDKSGNAHYHAIIFGLHMYEEMIPCGRSQTGQQYYRSPDLEKVWIDTEDRKYNQTAADQLLDPNLLGFVSCEPANYYTFKYVTAYVTKKLGTDDTQGYDGRQPCFSLSSKRPAIGYRYMKDHPGCEAADSIIIGTPDGKVEFPPPRYFKKYLRDKNPDLADKIAMRHLKKAKDIMDAKLKSKSMYYLDSLRDEENIQLRKSNERVKL